MALKLAEQVSRVHGSEVTPIRVTNKGLAAVFPASPALISEVVIERGSDTVAEALNRAAAASEAGMVVVGSHGRGDLAALLIGSVTHGLLAISEQPVLVVRGGLKEGP
jgi:nucleotide-binding universal stress UspA family protein